MHLALPLGGTEEEEALRCTARAGAVVGVEACDCCWFVFVPFVIFFFVPCAFFSFRADAKSVDVPCTHIIYTRNHNHIPTRGATASTVRSGDSPPSSTLPASFPFAPAAAASASFLWWPWPWWWWW